MKQKPEIDFSPKVRLVSNVRQGLEFNSLQKDLQCGQPHTHCHYAVFFLFFSLSLFFIFSAFLNFSEQLFREFYLKLSPTHIHLPLNYPPLSPTLSTIQTLIITASPFFPPPTLSSPNPFTLTVFVALTANECQNLSVLRTCTA